jgi:amino acid transporter
MSPPPDRARTTANPSSWSPAHHHNAPQIGIIGATAIGVGGMVGGGIFAVLGTAVTIAGSDTPLAFVLAGIIALLTAYSYAKLSVAFPCSGGTVVFLHRAFGIDLATGTLNVMLWLCYLVTIALYASAFGAYAETFFANPAPWLLHLLISIAIIVPSLINLLNSDIVGKSEIYVVGAKLLLLAIVIVAAIPGTDFSRIDVAHIDNPVSLIAGGMVIFVAYEGFELIANAAEEVKSPAHTLPIAVYASVLFVLVLYVLIAVVTVGSLDPAVIPEVKDYALAEAAKPSLGHAGFVLVSLSALLATFSAINATIYGNARLGYTLARDGELPEPLEHKIWHRPVAGVLLTALLSLLLANLVELTGIAIMGSAGFLIIFAVVNLSNLKLARTTGANRTVAAMGFISCIAALITLLYHTAEDNPASLAVVIGMVVSALLFEIIYPFLSGRELRL